MSTVLIIDDEPQIRRFLRIGLASQHHDIIEAADGKSGLESVVIHSPDLIILDLGLPDTDGQDVLKEIREFFSGPVIVLSVRDSEKEKVTALDNGANDYVVKPFGMQEFLARIRGLLRAVQQQQVSVELSDFDDGHLRIEPAQRRVYIDGEVQRLSRKEYALLMLLLKHRGRIVTQRQILTELWGKTHSEDSHYVRILVAKLRTSLKDKAESPEYIETEPGVGYRFLAPGPHH